MNKVMLQRNRNDVAQLIRVSNRHRDVLRWGSGETDEHIRMKLEICKYLKAQGEEFYTEAIFASNEGRADVIAVDRRLIIEVVESEGEVSKNLKSVRYPLPVVFVDARQKFSDKLIS